MARKPRYNLPGFPQHVVQRGNNRQACFIAAKDYQHYLQVLKEEAEECGCAVHAYVLMTNHVHLLVTPNVADGLSRMMQRLGTRYVRHINGVYRRTGTLWEGRFKSSLVGSDDYLLTCYRYIELNPVRAGMVRAPGDYPYSSYLANGLGRASHMLVPHPVYLELGTTPGERCHVYRLLFSSSITEEDLQCVRTSLNKELVYGDERFTAQIEAMIDRAVRAGRPGRPKLADDKKLY